MPRLERKKNNIIEFFEAQQDGLEIIYRKGKVGEHSIAQRRKYFSIENTQTAFQRMVNYRIKNGWTMVSDNISYLLPNYISLPRNHALETIIQKNPQDKEAWLVYADWLLMQNDIRGEILNTFYNIKQLSNLGAAKQFLYQAKNYYLSFLEPNLAKDYLYHWGYYVNISWKNGFIQTACFSIQKTYYLDIIYACACIFVEHITLYIYLEKFDITPILQALPYLSSLTIKPLYHTTLESFNSLYLKTLSIKYKKSAIALIYSKLPHLKTLKLTLEKIYLNLPDDFIHEIMRAICNNYPKLRNFELNGYLMHIKIFLYYLNQSGLIKQLERLVFTIENNKAITNNILERLITLAPQLCKLKILKVKVKSEEDFVALSRVFGSVVIVALT